VQDSTYLDEGSTVPDTGKPRLPAAERLAATRARLLDAVLDTVAERGYTATSTTEVARRSGLTRGAQLHHFGTKDQMMAAAAEHLAARTRATDIQARLAPLGSGPERLRTALTIMARMFTGPLPAAYIELYVASRAHPELRPALADLDVAHRDLVRALFGDQLLARGGPQLDQILDLAMYALRGMALDAHISGEDEHQRRGTLILALTPYLEQLLEV
jgi:AcrR family transcriptional regulator